LAKRCSIFISKSVLKQWAPFTHLGGKGATGSQRQTKSVWQAQDCALWAGFENSVFLKLPELVGNARRAGGLMVYKV
jgi:hypothetical protein